MDKIMLMDLQEMVVLVEEHQVEVVDLDKQEILPQQLLHKVIMVVVLDQVQEVQQVVEVELVELVSLEHPVALELAVMGQQQV